MAYEDPLEAVINKALDEIEPEPEETTTETEEGEETGETTETEGGDTGTEGESTETGETPAETGEDTSGDTKSKGGDGDAGTKEKPVEGAPATPDDPFAAEHGIKATDKHGRENRIPYSRVTKIVQNAQRKIVKAAGLDIADDATPEQVETTLKTRLTRLPQLEEENSQFRTKITEMDRVEAIMERDPERFLALLQMVHPQYAPILAGRVPAGTTETPTEEMPEPDYDLGDGNRTYSPEGLRKLLLWQATQTEKAVLAKLKPDLDPLLSAHQGQARLQQDMQRVTERVSHARQTFPGFAELETDILKALQDDSSEATRTNTRPKLTLETAYLRVRDEKQQAEVAKLKADRQTIRNEVIAEMKKAPKNTATSSTGGKKVEPKPKGTADPIEDAINRAIAGIES